MTSPCLCPPPGLCPPPSCPAPGITPSLKESALLTSGRLRKHRICLRLRERLSILGSGFIVTCVTTSGALQLPQRGAQTWEENHGHSRPPRRTLPVGRSGAQILSVAACVPGRSEWHPQPWAGLLGPCKPLSTGAQPCAWWEGLAWGRKTSISTLVRPLAPAVGTSPNFSDAITGRQCYLSSRVLLTMRLLIGRNSSHQSRVSSAEASFSAPPHVRRAFLTGRIKPKAEYV